VKKLSQAKPSPVASSRFSSSISVPEKEPPPEVTVTLEETIEALSNLFKPAAKASPLLTDWQKTK
jgi:hypothetical protein